MDSLVFILAVTTGVMAATITSPVVWLLIAFCFALGWSRSGVWTCIAMAIIFSGLVVYANWSLWGHFDLARAMRIFLPRLAYGMTAYGLGLLAVRMLRKEAT